MRGKCPELEFLPDLGLSLFGVGAPFSGFNQKPKGNQKETKRKPKGNQPFWGGSSKKGTRLMGDRAAKMRGCFPHLVPNRYGYGSTLSHRKPLVLVLVSISQGKPFWGYPLFLIFGRFPLKKMEDTGPQKREHVSLC